ncbi:NUDIX hydrolase [Velocimicrobium porci]|uniref:NUDIX hydrolase n=1 Tax=Velocimicrobium porci TaxID=2606634 RepID=A0A6L5XXQ6_9FIRM|nr:NUDIX hydrolase [Velocimicrobium porci]MSS63379.1 NUDIX hydrolase [Velocimicrobium porci]
MENFKRLKRELVHKGVIIDYYQDSIQVPNGNVAKWDFIQHKGAAAIVAVGDDGRLLMVRQYRNAVDRDTLEIPAGGLNPGEDKMTCAARELEEETGYRPMKIEHLLDMYTTVAFCNEKIGIYCGTDLVKTEQHLDEDEVISLEWYTLDELVDFILNGTIQDGKTIAAILAYKTKIEQ